MDSVFQTQDRLTTEFQAYRQFFLTVTVGFIEGQPLLNRLIFELYIIVIQLFILFMSEDPGSHWNESWIPLKWIPDSNTSNFAGFRIPLPTYNCRMIQSSGIYLSTICWEIRSERERSSFLFQNCRTKGHVTFDLTVSLLTQPFHWGKRSKRHFRYLFTLEIWPLSTRLITNYKFSRKDRDYIWEVCIVQGATIGSKSMNTWSIFVVN